MKRILSTILIIILSLPAFGSRMHHKDGRFALWKGSNERHFAWQVHLTPFIPEKNNPEYAGLAVVVCPGGSYSWLDRETEGEGVALWLNENGIPAFVLEYRTQGVPSFIFHHRLVNRGKRYPDALRDLDKAISTIKERAEEYNLDISRIGIMGFSAGGHLVMSYACNNDETSKQIVDFIVPIYPVVTMNGPHVHKRSRRALLGEYGLHKQSLRNKLSIELNVPQDCPPVFLVNCKDDEIVDYQNSVMLDSALTANNINHKYLLFEKGGHGFGASDKKGSEECRRWKNEFLAWIKNKDK